jgi:hypothetical protein
MKRIVIIFFAVITAFPTYCQTYLQDGDRCFENSDYTCAITKYTEAFKSASGKDKQIVDIKREKAKNCAKWIKGANQAFTNKNYKAAKEKYQYVLDSNPKDEYAKSQMEKCNNMLNPPTTLSVSKESLSFSSSGGNQSITVTSNASSYLVNVLPSWCTIQKYAGYFVITCSVNSTSTTRSDYLTVSAGDKTVRISVSQSGKGKTTLTTSTQNISFTTSGGKALIDVKTNAGDFQITYLPSWCRVGNKYSTWFSLECDANNKGRSRSDWFKVTADGKEVKIYVKQAGTNNSTTYKSSTSTEKCFNCPKTKDTWGLTLGYVQKKMDYFNLDGVQFGLRVEPLFKYGFGLNTGILLEAYSNDIESASYNDYESEFGQFALNIPLHLEYRLNFSKWFNIFVYGGAGLDVVTTSSFDNYAFPITFDYGGGLRISHVQLNVGQSLYLGDFKNIKYFGENIKTCQKIVVSISYMF